MTYKHFYRAIILRLIIIISLSSIITFLYFEKQAYSISGVLLLFLIAAVVNIIRYFNNVNKWISFFLLGIENEDSSLKIPTKTGNKAIDSVFIGIERLNDFFKQTKIEISAQEQHFRSVINQSATGLFSVTEKGRVININPSATKLTKLNDYHHVNSLTDIDKALPDFIMQTNKKLIQQSSIFENQYGQKLLFKLSKIKTQKEKITLVAVSNITKELDNSKIDAWIKLSRTLSHEIMNNIAPITTLSQVVSGYFTENKKPIQLDKINSATITNTVKGLKVIEERSLGLMNFVENYRKFTKLPEPQFKEVNISSLIENSLISACAFSGFENIKVKTMLPEKLMFSADEKLLSQVFINLIKNATEAMIEGKTKIPQLIIKALQIGNRVKIKVINNGPIIPPYIKEQIFIPFYTTKENGSGIGLSLSKQIMLKMGGDILLNKEENRETTFTILL